MSKKKLSLVDRLLSSYPKPEPQHDLRLICDNCDSIVCTTWEKGWVFVACHSCGDVIDFEMPEPAPPAPKPLCPVNPPDTEV